MEVLGLIHYEVQATANTYKTLYTHTHIHMSTQFHALLPMRSSIIITSPPSGSASAAGLIIATEPADALPGLTMAAVDESVFDSFSRGKAQAGKVSCTLPPLLYSALGAFWVHSSHRAVELERMLVIDPKGKSAKNDGSYYREHHGQHNHCCIC